MENPNLSALEAIVNEIEALESKAADLTLGQIQRMLDDLQSRHPKHKFSFAQIHGREWIEVTPVPLVGWQGYFAGRGVQSFDLVDLESAMKFAKKPKIREMLKGIQEILTVADYAMQKFHIELHSVEPKNNENKNETTPGSNHL